MIRCQTPNLENELRLVHTRVALSYTKPATDQRTDHLIVMGLSILFNTLRH